MKYPTPTRGLPPHGGLRPWEIEEALAGAGTPEQLKQRARDFLMGLAENFLINKGNAGEKP